MGGKRHHLIISGEELSPEGVELLGFLLDHCPALPRIPRELFLKIMSKSVPTALELALMKDNQVVLVWREDAWFRGWHLPGSYIAPRETIMQTAARIVRKEVPGIRIVAGAEPRIIGGFSNDTNPRFHDSSILTVADCEGEPQGERAEFFSLLDEPPDLIQEHKKFWQFLADRPG